MNLEISRREWLRNEGMIASRLLRPRDGKRCCVGIYCRALGISDSVLWDRSWPCVGELEFPTWLTEGPDIFTDNLAVTNDLPGLTEDDREYQIAAVFARHGVVVTFVD